MIQETDLLEVTAVITPTVATILGPVPPNMSALVYAETFAEDAASGVGTYTVKLMTQLGTSITGTVQVVTLSPANPTLEKGFEVKPILRVPAGQALLGQSETGTIAVTLIYVYKYGRVI